MDKESINRAEELEAQRQRLRMKDRLLNDKVEKIDTRINKLQSDRRSLINQKNLISRYEMKVLKELASLIHQDTCYTCANEKCGVKHDVFSLKCDKYDDGLPF